MHDIALTYLYLLLTDDQLLMCTSDTVLANILVFRREEGGPSLLDTILISLIIMWVCVLICDQWFDQWLIDLMLSDQVRVIRLLALINAASNFPLLYFFCFYLFLLLSPLSPSSRLNYTMRRGRILLNRSFIWLLVSRRSERQWIRLILPLDPSKLEFFLILYDE